MNTKQARQKPAASGRKSQGFTDEERTAMKERAQELKAAAQQADGASEDCRDAGTGTRFSNAAS